MARKQKAPIQAAQIRGLKYLRAFWDVLEPLRRMPAHGNRRFFMDQYVSLLLLHFFNPTLDSLRALQQATGLDNVQEVLGVGKTSLGAMSPEDRQAGVVSNQGVRMGSAFTEGLLTAPVRRLVIRGEKGKEIILLTNTDLPAEIIGLIYRYRWQVELFFRWFKCILKCTHWLSTTQTGLTLQVYVAVLASLLISLWTGRKPTKRTFEMICLYFQGWAKAEELAAHIESLKNRS